MFATMMQIAGLLALILAGAMQGPSALVAALGIVATYVGLAAERSR